eukprot:CAMPEP_0116120122 /NCGR_PEP_ID=MMETSP0329-20121206/3011_1 /TAXON_ID=697910 /ORGANISM="Pseudo-nitzschia arenysensis, Strain B593" /LENGTH=470 /DNA_ID=CAMNT_0003613879 /DNA_START=156 /DNA_END=1568 /DNA_ORIENTATION=+
MTKKLSFGSETVGLGVVSPHEIQVYNPGQNGSQGDLETESHTSLMSMSFPGATVLPFSIKGVQSAKDFDFLEQRLNYHNKSEDDKFWKALILYSTGNAADEIIVQMQEFMPNAVIVGGVCSEGHVSIPQFSKEELGSMSIKQLRYLSKKYLPNEVLGGGAVEKSDLVDHIFDTLSTKNATAGHSGRYDMIGLESVFGVFLGGDVPVKSVVSRGVHSVLNDNGPPRPFSNLVVHDVQLSKPGTDGYFFGEGGPPVHLIRKVRDKTSGIVHSPLEVIEKHLSSNLHRAQFLGLKREGHDGFELSQMNNLAMQLDTFVVVADGSTASEESLQGAEMDFFSLSGEACMEDMDRTMSKLREQTEGEEILGALMYTCCGRGPAPAGLIPERMSDATRFAKVFPNVPCLGFYANGEFGPVALAGNESVFQIGRSMHQGFTAVFALFIVPVKDGPASYNLDDSINNVQKFVREQLHQA